MASHLKEVLLVGFGAVGAMYALVLQRSGKVRLTVVARSNYSAIVSDGVHYKSAMYGEIKGWRPDRVFGTITEALDRSYDYVVITTKSLPQITPTPVLLAPLLSSLYADTYAQPVYVILQNGINVEVDLYQALKKLRPNENPRIISGALHIVANLLSDNVVEHHNLDRVLLGVYRPTPTITTNTPEESALLSDFAPLVSAEDKETTIVPEIQRVKYAKNVWNAIFGIIAAITRFPTDAIFCPPECRSDTEAIGSITPQDQTIASALAELHSASPAIAAYTIPVLHDAMSEIRALGEVLFPPSEAGPGLDPNIAMGVLKFTSDTFSQPGFRHKASTLVDVENGRPTELEVILGELVRMGRQRGVPMPRMETMYALMLIIQEQLIRQSREQRAAS